MYCKHCRSRTGNAFSADVGCRTFKRDELARHERIFHPKKLGSGNVQTMLSNEAARVKQTRIRTILAVMFLAVEKIALRKLPALAKLKKRSSSTRWDSKQPTWSTTTSG
jgi:hypothetical protein